MNLTVLIGNLTRDPEMKITNTGVMVTHFTLAVNRDFGEREADYFSVTAWRGLGENCQKYLKKGSQVAVIGRLERNEYESDGETRIVYQVIATDVQFLCTKRDNTGGNDNAEDPELPF